MAGNPIISNSCWGNAIPKVTVGFPLDLLVPLLKNPTHLPGAFLNSDSKGFTISEVTFPEDNGMFNIFWMPAIRY